MSHINQKISEILHDLILAIYIRKVKTSDDVRLLTFRQTAFEVGRGAGCEVSKMSEGTFKYVEIILKHFKSFKVLHRKWCWNCPQLGQVSRLSQLLSILDGMIWWCVAHYACKAAGEAAAAAPTEALSTAMYAGAGRAKCWQND